jgi:hypothetical protein
MNLILLGDFQMVDIHAIERIPFPFQHGHKVSPQHPPVSSNQDPHSDIFSTNIKPFSLEQNRHKVSVFQQSSLFQLGMPSISHVQNSTLRSMGDDYR